ncbi:hypothetical protein [Capnocytophaga cynodegmi]|nr:hypothetical protein [Capnocytophaga cynodegmi]
MFFTFNQLGEAQKRVVSVIVISSEVEKLTISLKKGFDFAQPDK